jgi:hypothetical protein
VGVALASLSVADLLDNHVSAGTNDDGDIEEVIAAEP